MTMIKISVTKDDIKMGEVKQYDRCPVALAMERATGHYISVLHTYFLDDGPRPGVRSFGRGQRPLPERVTDFIKMFDDETQTGCYSLLPFEFEIEDWRDDA
jgi:hypothetical protein